jgi:hypothetical protein
MISGELWVNVPAAAGDATLSRAAGLGTPDAMFDSGAFNYNPTDSGSIYTIGSFLNNPTFTNQSLAFTSAGGGNANLNNTYFYFTGTISLNAGMNTFVVGHDDGLQLNIDGIGLVVDRPGPTGLDETPFTVTAPAAGNYNIELSYGECCGPPASLVWQVNGATVTSSVPEPASAVLFVIGLSGMAVARRRLGTAA